MNKRESKHIEESRETADAISESEEVAVAEGMGEEDDGQPQEIYVAHSRDKQLIPGLKMGTGIMTVEKWDSSKRARGWNVTGANLTLDRGRPFGSLWYRNDDGRTVRVGVHWNRDVEQLECLCLHPNKPQLADDVDGSEAARLERDARSRIGTLIAINAEVGSFVASMASEDAILEAAGLGLKRVDA